jgi:hypothetical protein
MGQSGIKKNFIARNDAFTCEQCQAHVPPASGTYRNHCPQCLTSKHVDQDTPGDRASTCCGLMPTVAIEGTDPDELDLIQRCETCGKTQRNRRASDDISEKIFKIIQSR